MSKLVSKKNAMYAGFGVLGALLLWEILRTKPALAMPSNTAAEPKKGSGPAVPVKPPTQNRSHAEDVGGVYKPEIVRGEDLQVGGQSDTPITDWLFGGPGF